MKQSVQDSWIEAVKSCGQSLIDNAEQIASEYPFQTGTEIKISLQAGEFAEITVSQMYLPTERKKSNKFVVMKAE